MENRMKLYPAMSGLTRDDLHLPESTEDETFNRFMSLYKKFSLVYFFNFNKDQNSNIRIPKEYTYRSYEIDTDGVIYKGIDMDDGSVIVMISLPSYVIIRTKGKYYLFINLLWMDDDRCIDCVYRYIIATNLYNEICSNISDRVNDESYTESNALYNYESQVDSIISTEPTVRYINLKKEETKNHE